MAYINNNPELVGKIEQLFSSEDERNVALACELMKGGGMPTSVAQQLENPQARLYFLINYGLTQPFLLETALNISRLGLNSLPSEFGELTSLQELNLFYNHLSIMPEEICQLPKLRKLLLHHNQLTSLPESIGNLTQLEELVLSFNQLTELPFAMDRLENLKILYLHHNQLTTLPSSLEQLPHLQKITLWNNAFIPEEELQLQETFHPIELVF